MAESSSKKNKSQTHGTTSRKLNTELINVRFYENQKRQALLTTRVDNEEEDAVEGTDNLLVTSVKETIELCDTVADDSLQKNPPHSSEQPVDPSSSSVTSSLAISAPTDKSRKGSVDQKIWNLVNLINREKDSFFTTSSCSGRIILYTWDVIDGNEEVEATSAPAVSSSKLKKGCKWLLVSHDEIQPEELVNAYFLATTPLSAAAEDKVTPTGETDVYFKMEPCILHVQCRTLSNARKLIHIATESGFRNSGMVIGKENRITVAIRSAMGLEVPLPTPGISNEKRSESQKESRVLNVSKEYLKYLTQIANAKLKENWTRSEKLTKLFAETSWNV